MKLTWLWMAWAWLLMEMMLALLAWTATTREFCLLPPTPFSVLPPISGDRV